ncbi:conserved hypothetical protein [Frankia canadensis]|uniref:Uncharacterized protein n=1 Tax=Frankia canadensis TaxID=1836972 RepID=A0A2I2KSG5_9ACTN|nr:hypothetical protein [Frankia canadensis]SNQ48618.1 conserved hypothetical protein [Frankia canadensis]SOU55908.1 conserved hypothetical protein [Frankia canadensis]
MPEDSSPIDETSTAPAPGLPTIEAAPYDPQERLDSVRSYIAFSLIGLLALVVLCSFALLATAHWTHLTLQEVRPLIEVIFSSVTTLVSAATGFYFGVQHAQTKISHGRRPAARSRQ